ncbi:MAG: hypothetical protein M4579_003818 [Chaenotheca gracillima]|nr:MAG: hypothetical protein M4579_003818 [Chaenotheca gracillima]
MTQSKHNALLLVLGVIFVWTNPSCFADNVDKLFLSQAVSNPQSPLQRPKLEVAEWIALGDSYASGVGGGELLEDRRCLRFNDAYPIQMQSDDRLLEPIAARKFTNAACSGATTQDVLDWQLLDSEDSQLMYGSRPAFGTPQFATITIGGDDMDFFDLVNNCIYEFIPTRPCQEQLNHSLQLLHSPNFTKGLDTALARIIEKGRKAQGSSFKLYVTGYSRFFNDDTDRCSNETWSVWSGWPGSQPRLTKELRKTLNNMADDLNQAVSNAALRAQDHGVVLVPWSDETHGNRGCEERSLDAGNEDTNAWYYQLTSHDSDTEKGESIRHTIARIIDPLVKDANEFVKKHHEENDRSPVEINPNITTYQDFRHALSDAHNWGDQDGEKQNALIQIVRVFHPKTQWQNLIARKILHEVKKSGFKSMIDSPPLDNA